MKCAGCGESVDGTLTIHFETPKTSMKYGACPECFNIIEATAAEYQLVRMEDEEDPGEVVVPPHRFGNFHIKNGHKLVFGAEIAKRNN